jgi:predicted glycoside hydrolase/deacetylase ChbG (UPF0249 family)
MIRNTVYVLAVGVLAGVLGARDLDSVATGPPTEVSPIEVLIRCDDIGMSHAVNAALMELLETGLPLSVSVMFACPWYQEAVDILREHPEVSVGVHLTLNAEWKNYRWGPVAGACKVSTLVDEDGYFFPSRALFQANNPRRSHVKMELTAQIERALRSGLHIDYVDYHMGTAVERPEHRAIVEQLARKYNLGISRYFGEADTRSIYSVPYSEKPDSLIAFLEYLDPEVMNLWVFHIGTDTPELAHMKDLNPFGLPEMSKHRQAELDALTAPAFRAALEEKDIRLLTYRELIAREGLESMRLREDSGY